MFKSRKGNQNALGHRHSKETRLKMSIANSGKTMSGECKENLSVAMSGNGNIFFGRKHSEESKRKMSLANSGSNNANWQGGIACEPYCDAWADQEYKDDIKERDNHTCQNPDCWGNCNHLSLTVHHIDYIKKNCHPQNLITLCVSCNGRANFNREYWTQFYQKIRTRDKQRQGEMT